MPRKRLDAVRRKIRRSRRRRGLVLVMVLVVVALLSLAAYTFSEMMLSERMAADAHGRKAQARAIAESGIELAKQVLTEDEETQVAEGGVYNNPNRFRGIVVSDAAVASQRGSVSLMAPLLEDGQPNGVRFGLEDESTKLNLNTLMEVDKQSRSGGASQLMQAATQAASGSSGATSGGSGSSGSGAGGSGSRGGGSQAGAGAQSGGGSQAGGGSQTGGGQGSEGNQGGGKQGGSGGQSAGGAASGSQTSRSTSTSTSATPKIPPNAGRELLMKLPNMTEDIADAILDWMDSDDEPREQGAEQEYYSGLNPGYAPSNRVPETIDELLLVKGVTPELLFGPDANRNGMIDPSEQATAEMLATDTPPGTIDRGWAGFLTLHSKEKNVRPDGTPRINANGDDLEQLNTDLQEAVGSDWATFIIAYRQFGPYTGKTGTVSSGTVQLDLKKAAKSKLTNVLDLVGAKVQVQQQSGQSSSRTTSILLESPVPANAIGQSALLTTLLDNVSVNPNPTIPGRVNINQAPRTLLQGIPGMTAEMVEEIMSRRDPEFAKEKPERRHETWLLTEGIVTLDEMKALLPFVTSGGSVFRSQIVGYFEQGGVSARIEAVIDASTAKPRLLFWRDLSHLGRGYPLATLGVGAAQ